MVGTEPTANTTSVSSISMRAASRGVAARLPFTFVKNLCPSRRSDTGMTFCNSPRPPGRLNVALVVPTSDDLRSGEHEKGAEGQQQPRESADETRAQEDEARPEDEGTEDPAEQDPMLVLQLVDMVLVLQLVDMVMNSIDHTDRLSTLSDSYRRMCRIRPRRSSSRCPYRLSPGTAQPPRCRFLLEASTLRGRDRQRDQVHTRSRVFDGPDRGGDGIGLLLSERGNGKAAELLPDIGVVHWIAG